MEIYPFTGGTPERSSSIDDQITFPLKIKWKHKLLFGMGNPVIGDGELVFSIPNHITLGKTAVVALDLDTGRQRWEITPEGSTFIQENICIYEDKVFFSNGNSLYGVKRDSGDIVWKNDLEILNDGVRENGNGAMVCNAQLYVNGKHGICSLKPETGEIVWCYKTDEKIAIPVIHGSRLLFGDYFLEVTNIGGNLFCLDLDSHALVWKRSVREIGAYYDIVLSKLSKEKVVLPGKFFGLPMIADRKIFGTLSGRYLSAFDIDTGSLVWRTKDLCLIIDPLYKSQRLYGFDMYGFHCYDANTGDVIFQQKIEGDEGSPYNSTPFIAGSTFLAGNARGLYAFNTDSGKMVWKFPNKIKSGGFIRQPIFIGGRLYAGCIGDHLYCFESK